LFCKPRGPRGGGKKLEGVKPIPAISQ